MKKLVLVLAVALTTTIAFAQKKSEVTYNVGATALYPIAKSVDTKSHFIGQTLEVACKPNGQKVSYTASAKYLQNKSNYALIPVAVGVRYPLYNNLSVGLETGVTLNNSNSDVDFIYSPSVSLALKKFTLSQVLLTTVKDGKSSSIIGLALSYRL
jgi:hypothetical protein